jgi:hypothetical protein
MPWPPVAALGIEKASLNFSILKIICSILGSTAAAKKASLFKQAIATASISKTQDSW